VTFKHKTYFSLITLGVLGLILIGILVSRAIYYDRVSL